MYSNKTEDALSKLKKIVNSNLPFTIDILIVRISAEVLASRNTSVNSTDADSRKKRYYACLSIHNDNNKSQGFYQKIMQKPDAYVWEARPQLGFTTNSNIDFVP